MAPGVKSWLKAGAKVEVSSGEDGFVGSWYAAKVLCQRKRVFTIQYETLVTEKGDPVVEQALRKHLRPIPPLLEAKQWAVGDLLEAYDNDGWWMGVVADLLPRRNRFLVYFETTAEKKVFSTSQIRPRQDWLHGKWVIMTQGFKDNVEVNAGDSKERIADGSLFCGTVTDVQPPQHTKLMGLPGHMASQVYIGGSPVQSSSLLEKINPITEKQRVHDGSPHIECTKDLSQAGQGQQPSTICQSPCESDLRHSNRDSPSLQKRKKSRMVSSPIEEAGIIVPMYEPEILSTGPIPGADGDKRLCLRETQSEMLSKGTRSPPLQQINEISEDIPNVSCSAARGRSEPLQQVEPNHFENKARLTIAKHHGIMTAGKVCPSHLCCSCATANFPELESLSGYGGGTAECASTLRTQNLELKAYAAVLHAFYSKGPITWQQELLITDLRRHLNISSEEHLLQLLQIMSHT